MTIFQQCETEFLHDIVLKMQTFIFTPGDLVCRRGEVAREMFIVSDGMLEVIKYVYLPVSMRERGGGEERDIAA